jgi:malonyl-CoA O-methyltransferase
VLPAKDAYERWADTYPPIAHNPLMRVEEDMLKGLLAPLHASRALDVGTGSGRCLPLLAATGALTVIGLDFSRGMLSRGSFKAPRVCGDACRLPFRRATFDLINASLIVGDVSDLSGWIGEMAHALVPGGHLIYSDFHPSWAKNGWQRTFRTLDGDAFDVPYVPHSIEDHLSALEQARLQMIAIREPRFREDADPAVKTFRRRWGNPPVIVVFHVVKTGRCLHQPTAASADGGS